MKPVLFVVLFIVSSHLKPANCQASYFPPKTFHSDSERSHFEREWYSEVLERMHEPKLTAGQSKVALRFLWLRSFDDAVAIRVETSSDGTATIYTKVVGTRGGPHSGQLYRDETKSLSPEQVNTLLHEITKVSFWNIPPWLSRNGCDGAQWIIEGVQSSNYRLVDRWSPETGPIRELGLLFLNLSGYEVAKGHLY